MAVVVRTADLGQHLDSPLRDGGAEMADACSEEFDAYREITSTLRRVIA